MMKTMNLLLPVLRSAPMIYSSHAKAGAVLLLLQSCLLLGHGWLDRMISLWDYETDTMSPWSVFCCSPCNFPHWVSHKDNVYSGFIVHLMTFLAKPRSSARISRDPAKLAYMADPLSREPVSHWSTDCMDRLIHSFRRAEPWVSRKADYKFGLSQYAGWGGSCLQPHI